MEKVVVEIGFVGGQYSAHQPELPGCITVGSSIKEIEDNIAEVVHFHIDEQRVVVALSRIGRYQ